MAEVSGREVQPRAQAALANSPIYELRELQVEQTNGSLLISGTVSSFYHKQLAQEVVRAVCNYVDFEVINTIRVR
jgi:osmotically-inducible protein OsmY